MSANGKDVMYLYRPGWTLVQDDALWQETLQFAVRTGADAILAFNEHFQTPPHPDFDRIREHVSIMKKRFADVRKHGMIPMINFFVTLGHSAAKPASNMNKFQEIIDGYGNQVLGCICPLDPDFQEYICESYRMYAELDVESIWIDDDFRLYDREGAETLQCFCDYHLDLFAKQSGKRYTREELFTLLVEHKNPDRELRREWFALQGESLVQLIHKLRKAVLSVNPNVGLGIMIPHVPVNVLSGRDLNKEFEALQTPALPLPWVRTGGGFYTDERPLDLLEKIIQVADPIPAIVQAPAQICCEIENYPFIQGKKSGHTLALEMFLNTISSNGLLSFSIHDGYLGLPFASGTVEKTIIQMKPYLAEVVKAKEGKVRKGVSVPFPTNRVEIGELDRNKLTPHWNMNIARLGIPQAPTDMASVILTGSEVELFSQEQLIEMLQKGAILDPEAYLLLRKSSILNDCPIEVKEQPFSTRAQSERITAEHAPDWLKSKMLPTRWHISFNSSYQIYANEEAEQWSGLYDTEGNLVSSGVVVAEKPYRIAVVAYTGQPLRELGRQWLMQQVVNYVSRSKPPVMVEEILEMYPVWHENGQEAVLGLAYFGMESYDSVTLWLPGREGVARLERLDRCGSWVQEEAVVSAHPQSGIRLTLLDQSIPAPLSFETFRVRFV